MLAGTAAAVIAAARGADATTTRAPRRHILSFNPQSANMQVTAVNQRTTFVITMPLETQVEALRVGMANIAPDPYALEGICCCEGELWNSAPGSEWAYFTFSGAGTDAGTGAGEQPRAPARARQTCVVPGNHPVATGATNVPMIYWSDWMRYRTHAASGRPQLLLRMLAPPQSMTLTQSGARGNVADSIPGLPPWTLAQWQIPGDFVTQPSSPMPRPYVSGLTPLYVLQYRVAAPGIQIVIGGDSHLTAWYTFARQAGIVLSTPELPISTWDAAFGAQASRTFWPCLDEAIDAAFPSVCLIEGWGFNDGGFRPPDLVYQERIRESAQRVMRQGGVPVIMKAMPRHLLGTQWLAEWQWANQQLDHLVPGALVFDPGPYIYDPEQPGNWRADASSDGIHPNIAGSVALRGPFESLLKNLL
jgi:hypothetical protein